VVLVHCLIEAVRREPTVDLRELLHLDQVVTLCTGPPFGGDLFDDWTMYLDGWDGAAAAAVLTFGTKPAW
jgi:hypothetical protein